MRKVSIISCFFALYIVLCLCRDVKAFELPYYDLNSLVYQSTDIVVAQLSSSSDPTTNKPSTIEVKEIWLGSLQPGVRIENLDEYLEIYRPMETGQYMIIFLQKTIPDSPALYKPYAVVPSGIYLVDTHNRVHIYFPRGDRDPYVAEGYEYIPGESLKTPSIFEYWNLPTFNTVHSQVTASLAYVSDIRPLLEKTPNLTDITALKSIIIDENKFILPYGSPIIQKANEQIRAASHVPLTPLP